MDLSCASAEPDIAAARAMPRRMRRFMIASSNDQIAAQEGGGFAGLRLVEKCRGISVLDDAAARQEYDVAREPACLPDVVRRHHDLDACVRDLLHDILDRLGWRGIEAPGRLLGKTEPPSAPDA